MVRKLIQVVCLCLAGFPGIAWAGETPPFDLNDPARIEAGRVRFSGSCTGYCHGNEGRGGRAPDFINRNDFDADYFFRTITNGKRDSGLIMPRWGDTYSPEEIWELVAYLQFLSKKKS